MEQSVKGSLESLWKEQRQALQEPGGASDRVPLKLVPKSSDEQLVLSHLKGILFETPTWNQMCDMVVEFRMVNGHCNVPKSYSKPLYVWHQKQKRRLPNSFTPQEATKLLQVDLYNEYVMDNNNKNNTTATTKKKAPRTSAASDQRFAKMVQTLQQYKDQHGHCLVPSIYPENPSLTSWVRQQRRKYVLQKLSPPRIRILERMGFVWVAVAGRKKNANPSEQNGE